MSVYVVRAKSPAMTINQTIFGAVYLVDLLPEPQHDTASIA